MVSVDGKESVKQGYLYIKSPKKPSTFHKTWYKAYFVLQHDPFVLEEYKSSSLKMLRQLHHIESISHVAKFTYSKSQQFAFEVVLDDCEQLVFGCDNPILLTEWMTSFKQIIDILKCGSSMNTINFHTEYEHFQVLVLETKLSKANCLRGIYILLINQLQISLYSKNDFTEVLSWPINCMSFQSSQPTSKRLIFVMGKGCHFGFGVLKFETSACKEILDCIKAHSDASKDKYLLNISESSKNEQFLSTNQQIFDSDVFLPSTDLENEDLLADTSGKYTNNNDFSYCDKYQSCSSPKILSKESSDNKVCSNINSEGIDNRYITPNAVEPNRKVFHDNKGYNCEQHSACSTSSNFKSNNDVSYFELVEKENEKIRSIEKMLNSITSELADPIKHQVSLSAAKRSIIVNNSPKDSPELPPKFNSRRSSEPMNYQVNDNLKSKYFDEVLGNFSPKVLNNSPKVCEKRFGNCLIEFQNRLKSSPLNRKSVFKKPPNQVLHHEVVQKTEKPPELDRNMKPGWGAPIVKNSVQVTEQGGTVDIPPPVPERVASPALISKRLCKEYISLEENCNESNELLSANQISYSPQLRPKLNNVSQILTDDPIVHAVNSFAGNKEENLKKKEISSSYPHRDAKCIFERENVPILTDCINLQANMKLISKESAGFIVDVLSSESFISSHYNINSMENVDSKFTMKCLNNQNSIDIDSHLQKLTGGNKFLPKILFEKTSSSLFPKPQKKFAI